MKWMKLLSVMNEIEVNLFHEKLNFINDTYQKELQYWKKIVFLTKNERKELTDLAPPRLLKVIKVIKQFLSTPSYHPFLLKKKTFFIRHV